MGYTRFITYTLPEEGGSSVKAAGFRLDGTVPARKMVGIEIAVTGPHPAEYQQAQNSGGSLTTSLHIFKVTVMNSILTF